VETASKESGPYKTLYNRFVRWSQCGVFERMLLDWSVKEPSPERIMIGATHLKARRTAAC
jgi:hypothetical protein